MGLVSSEIIPTTINKGIATYISPPIIVPTKMSGKKTTNNKIFVTDQVALTATQMTRVKIITNKNVIITLHLPVVPMHLNLA